MDNFWGKEQSLRFTSHIGSFFSCDPLPRSRRELYTFEMFCPVSDPSPSRRCKGERYCLFYVGFFLPSDRKISLTRRKDVLYDDAGAPSAYSVFIGSVTDNFFFSYPHRTLEPQIRVSLLKLYKKIGRNRYTSNSVTELWQVENVTNRFDSGSRRPSIEINKNERNSNKKWLRLWRTMTIYDESIFTSS